MKKLLSTLACVISIAVVFTASAEVGQSRSSPAPLKLLAAGSLTGALTAAAQVYTARTGQEIEAEFGPSGLLRERIENGEKADLYISASMRHPQRLADLGIATQPIVVTRNEFCATTLSEFDLTKENFLERLLDPDVGIGTSTPGADPAGDYAWMLFAKANKIQPGAQEILEEKAQQIVGGKNNPPIPEGQDPIDYAFAQGTIDIFLGYCSRRQPKPDPKYATVEAPAALAITANYGLSLITRGGKPHEAAYKFALFLLSPQAQKILAQYGFAPVAIPVKN